MNAERLKEATIVITDELGEKVEIPIEAVGTVERRAPPPRIPPMLVSLLGVAMATPLSSVNRHPGPPMPTDVLSGLATGVARLRAVNRPDGPLSVNGGAPCPVEALRRGTRKTRRQRRGT
jgi:hypothetical protein